MNRRYVLRDKEILTPEAVNAILAKELLMKASESTDLWTGNLISGFAKVQYAYIVFRASDTANQKPDDDDSALLTMLASEAVLRREWDNPEEDEAWADLLKAK
ncbi:MAG TPA: hypothetical protein VE961_23665 [Pyrinomonadaceae bacterium]|nr:hypothetical protein [Pyrinomonadaceae bacterium]